MEKEFEALKRLYLTRCSNKTADKDYKLLQQALTELQAIKEAKPSEALDKLEKIVAFLGLTGCLDSNEGGLSSDLYVIEQALLKAQEQEKVLDLIFTKKIHIWFIEITENAFEYNRFLESINCPINQEEFELLKRWAEVLI